MHYTKDSLGFDPKVKEPWDKKDKGCNGAFLAKQAESFILDQKIWVQLIKAK